MAEIVYTLESAAQMLFETANDATKAEQERILGLVESEIKDWYSQPNISPGLSTYRDGCIDALKHLARLISK